MKEVTLTLKTTTFEAFRIERLILECVGKHHYLMVDGGHELYRVAEQIKKQAREREGR